MAGRIKNISLINTAEASPDVMFGDVWYEPGGEFGPRIQPDYQLVIMHLGEAHVSFDDETCVIPPGSVALMLPGRREYFRFSRHHPTHHTWCEVHPSMVPSPLRRRLARLPAVRTVSQTFESLMKAAFSIGSWRKKEGQGMLRVLGIVLLEEYVRMAKEGLEEENRESPHARGRRYLEDHFSEEDCLKGAARAAGITPQHLIRLFRQHYRVTPRAASLANPGRAGSGIARRDRSDGGGDCGPVWF